jgi:hypothetical protein
MQGINADEFIDSMLDGEASVRYKSCIYRFSGVIYHPARNTYSISIEKYRRTKEPFEEFIECVYYVEDEDENICLDKLTQDILWDGKTFYQLEKALQLIDW